MSSTTTAATPPAMKTLRDVRGALQAAGLPTVTADGWLRIRNQEPVDRLRQALRKAPMDQGARTYLERLVGGKPSAPVPPAAPASNVTRSSAPAASAPTPPPTSNTRSPVRSAAGTSEGTGHAGLVGDEPDRYSIHVYGGKAALCFEADTTRGGVATVALDAASGQNRQYDWTKKVRLQMTRQELPIVAAVFLGFLPKCEFKSHGPNKDKGFSLERQAGGKVFARVFAKDQGVKAVPIEAADAFYVAGLFIRQLLKTSPWLDSTGLIATLRNIVAER